jgi:lipopolysaccharide export system protein LptA
MGKKIIIYIYCLLSLGISNIYAQKTSIKNTDGDSHIEILNSNSLEYRGDGIKRLLGNVLIKSGDALMACDSAYVYDEDKRFKAFSHIHINQGDSMQLDGDVLEYASADKIAHIEGHVILKQGKMQLTTDRLDYDMKKKTGIYYNGAKIINGSSTLTSKIGLYYSNTKELFFKKDVVLTNPEYQVKTDTMRYMTESEVSYFFGPTYIVTQDKDTIYCENGWYDTKKDKCLFSKNAFIISGKQRLAADSLSYNRLTGIGKGYRKIVFTDTAEKITLKGNYGEYFQKQKTAVITDSALAIQVIDSDELYIHADTLWYIGDSASERMIKAYHGARLFKSDIQAVADSMTFSFTDSTMRLYANPVMWNKENQLTADTIFIYQQKKKIDYIALRNNAFICSRERGNHYNQIHGANINGLFEKNELHEVLVMKKGESLYYIKEDSSRYTGINRITCDHMSIYLTDKQVKGIKFYTENKGEIIPVNTKPAKELRIKGFTWQQKRRPLNADGVFDKIQGK